MPDPLIVVLGPTAAGKTKLAVALAQHFNGEIISADSRQVFRSMDIGTGKDLDEYEVGGQHVPYHLINIKQAGERYQVNAFKEDFYAAFKNITTQKKLPILCGGTGMYIHAVLQQHELTAVPVNETLRHSLAMHTKEMLQYQLNQYPKPLRAHADQSTVKRLVRAIEIAEYLTNNELQTAVRPEMEVLVIGLANNLELRRQRILNRLALRLENGLVQEVETLLAMGISKEMLTFYGLEYKFVTAYLTKEIDFDTLKERLGIAICQFAKRQLTFFRKMEKDGIPINWLDADEGGLKEKAIRLIESKYDLK